jgi:ABC-2 type transport system permease protein
MTRLLIWLQWRQLVHRRVSIKQTFAFAIGGLFALAFVGFLTFGMVEFGRGSATDQFRALATIALTLASIILLLAVIPQVFEQLFAGRDLDLLFTLPIPTHSIFIIRYGEMLARTGSLVLIIVGVPLIGYGIAAGAAWLYFPVVLVSMVNLIAWLVALSYLINLALIRIIPASRAKEVMTVLAMLTGLVGAVGGQLFGYVASQNNVGDRLSDLPTVPIWLPSAWTGIAIDEAADGHFTTLLPTVGLLTLAVGTIFLSLMLVERSFRVGWVQMKEGRGQRAGKHARTEPTTQRLMTPVRAVALKEIRLLQRDVREWMSLLPFFVFVGYSLLRSMGNRDISQLRNGSLSNWLLIQVILVGTFGLSISTFAAPSVAREGLSVWLLRTVPLPGIDVALGKFLVYWSISNAMLLVFEVGLALYLRWPVTQVVLGVVGLSVLSSGVVGIGLWTGTFGARYDPDRPNKRLKVGISFVLMGLTGIYLLVATAPLAIALLIAETLTDLTSIGAVAGIAWMLAAGLGVTLLMLWLTARRVDAGIQVEIVESG